MTENDPLVDSAANQGLWAEMSVYPAAYLTDPRVRWEAVDDLTARLYIPWRRVSRSSPSTSTRRPGAFCVWKPCATEMPNLA